MDYRYSDKNIDSQDDGTNLHACSAINTLGGYKYSTSNIVPSETVGFHNSSDRRRVTNVHRGHNGSDSCTNCNTGGHNDQDSATNYVTRGRYASDCIHQNGGHNDQDSATKRTGDPDESENAMYKHNSNITGDTNSNNVHPYIPRRLDYLESIGVSQNESVDSEGDGHNNNSTNNTVNNNVSSSIEMCSSSTTSCSQTYSASLSQDAKGLSQDAESVSQDATSLSQDAASLSHDDSYSEPEAEYSDNDTANSEHQHPPYVVRSSDYSYDNDTMVDNNNISDAYHPNHVHVHLPYALDHLDAERDVDAYADVDVDVGGDFSSQHRHSMLQLTPISLLEVNDTGDATQYCPSSDFHFQPAYVNKKSVCVTYILALLLGLVGGHHFYLNRPKFGTLYVFTAGLLGIGYVVDLIRVPWLVENANLEIMHPELRGKRYTGDAYLLWAPPFGLLGFHHFYLKNWFIAVVYVFSGGGLLLGWLSDLLLISAHWLPLVNILIPPNLQYSASDTMSQDRGYYTTPAPGCEVSSVDIHDTSVDEWGYPSDFVSELPSYTEVDELGPDPYSPPPYCEVLTLGYTAGQLNPPQDTPSTYV